MTIHNDHVTFWRNFRHFLILCILVTATSRLSLVRCGTSSDGDQHFEGEFKNFALSWAVYDGEESGSGGCNSLCIIAILLSIIVLITLIICIVCIRKNQKKSDKGKREIRIEHTSRTITDYLPRFLQRDSGIRVTSSPPETDIANNEAEVFLDQNPPREEIPTSEEIGEIRKRGGAKAWEWVPDEQYLAQQVVSLDKERNILTFRKRQIVMIQTNHPFFVPIVEGDVLYEKPFKLPKSAADRGGQVLHYFEVTVIENPEGRNTNIAIGLATKPYPSFRLPGWNTHSVSYNSIDGRKFNDAYSQDYAETWSVGDTIGCGYTPDVGNVFFTKNGHFLGNAFMRLFFLWYPTVGATGPCTLKVNFGDDLENEFLYESAKGYGPGGPLLMSFERRRRLSRRGSSITDSSSLGRIV